VVCPTVTREKYNSPNLGANMVQLSAPRCNQFVAHFNREGNIYYRVAMNMADLAPFTQAVFCPAKTMWVFGNSRPAHHCLPDHLLSAFDGHTGLLTLKRIQLRQPLAHLP
jgi:hypothetical protein